MTQSPDTAALQQPASTLHSEARGGTRLQSLDLLRFLAALAVTAYHFAPVLPGLPEWANSLRFGYLGVELFFMISGFVIALSVQGRTWRSFLVHRAVRLYPTFWAALVVAIPIAIAVGHKSVPLAMAIANFTMLPGYLGQPFVDDVYWTLGVEWKFYAIMCLLVAAGLHRKLDKVGTGWAVALLLIHAGLSVPGLKSALMFPYGAHFAFGLLVMDSRKSGLSAVRAVGLTVAFAAMLLATGTTYGSFIPNPVDGDGTTVGIIMGIMALGFCLVLSVRIRWLEQPWFRRLGATTYPLYLIHASLGKVLLEFWKPALPTGVTVAISLGLTLVFVLAATFLIEERVVPAISRSRFIARLAGNA